MLFSVPDPECDQVFEHLKGRAACDELVRVNVKLLLVCCVVLLILHGLLLVKQIDILQLLHQVSLKNGVHSQIVNANFNCVVSVETSIVLLLVFQFFFEIPSEILVFLATQVWLVIF